MKNTHRASHVKVYVHSDTVFNICQTKSLISRWYTRQECKLNSLNNLINIQCCKCLVSFVYGKITTPRSTALLYTPMRVTFLLLLWRGLTVFNCEPRNFTFFPLLKSILSESDLHCFDIQAIFHFQQRRKISMNGQVYRQTSASVPVIHKISMFCHNFFPEDTPITDMICQWCPTIV